MLFKHLVVNDRIIYKWILGKRTQMYYNPSVYGQTVRFVNIPIPIKQIIPSVRGLPGCDAL
jgi:hypothetical protein